MILLMNQPHTNGHAVKEEKNASGGNGEGEDARGGGGQGEDAIGGGGL